MSLLPQSGWRTLSSPPKIPTRPFAVSPLSTQAQAATDLKSVGLACLDVLINWITQYVTLCVWLCSFGTVLLRFPTLCIKAGSLSLQSNISLHGYTTQCGYPFTADGQWGCKKAAFNSPLKRVALQPSHREGQTKRLVAWGNREQELFRTKGPDWLS